MKRILYLLLAIVIILAISCKKDKPTNPEPKSQWQVDGKNFKGYAKSYPLGSEFSATDSIGQYGFPVGNYVAIKFYYTYWPTKNGTYTVTNWPGDSTQCSVTTGNLSTVPIGDYTSIASTSEVVITVSSAGKLSATFSGIVLSNYNSTKTAIVSGALVEQ